MQNVLLIYPVQEDGFPSFTPLGLCSIGTVLEERGYKVKIIDLRWQKKEELKKSVHDVDLVGIGPVTTMHALDAFELAQFCKSVNEDVACMHARIKEPCKTTSIRMIVMFFHGFLKKDLMICAKASIWLLINFKHIWSERLKIQTIRKVDDRKVMKSMSTLTPLFVARRARQF